MTRYPASAILLTVRGILYLTLALADWLAAKANASKRPYLIPFSVAREFCAAIGAAWQGQPRRPSLLACTQWSRKAGGPSRSSS
jgi:hypothetical protein